MKPSTGPGPEGVGKFLKEKLIYKKPLFDLYHLVYA
jgi:hypothetical protein